MQTTQISLSPRASVAMAILAAVEGEYRLEHPEIEDISKFLFHLYQAKIDIGDVALRSVPAGFYSEDVEILIGHFLGSGRAQKMSPVRFGPDGVSLLHEILDDEKVTNPEGVQQAARIVGLRL